MIRRFLNWLANYFQPERSQGGYCAICREAEHDVCGDDPHCPCCQDTWDPR